MFKLLSGTELNANSLSAHWKTTERLLPSYLLGLLQTASLCLSLAEIVVRLPSFPNISIFWSVKQTHARSFSGRPRVMGRRRKKGSFVKGPLATLTSARGGKSRNKATFIVKGGSLNPYLVKVKKSDCCFCN